MKSINEINRLKVFFKNQNLPQVKSVYLYGSLIDK